MDLKVVRRLRRYALVPSKTPRKVILVAHKCHSTREMYQLSGPNLASFPTSGGSAPPKFLVRFPNIFITCLQYRQRFVGFRLNVVVPFSVCVCSVCLRIGGPREPPSNPKAVSGGPQSCVQVAERRLGTFKNTS